MNSQPYLTSIELEDQALDAYCASPPFETLNSTNMTPTPKSVQAEVLARREKDLAYEQAQSINYEGIAAIAGGAIIVGITIFSVIESTLPHFILWLAG